MPIRIAMWSGPRNISTAMMRAFENRPDTIVCDEPFYAYYLDQTGAPHPGADEVIHAGDTDWRSVSRALVAPLPSGAEVFFQKHMAHHLLPEIERGWLDEIEHAFLVRDPREMLLSLSRVMPAPSVEDTGLPQQVELFEAVRERTGTTPPVVDSRDVLENPDAILRELCAALKITFMQEMLSWPVGARASDGVWARYWYGSVLETTGFARWRPRTGELSPQLERVRAACEPYYRRLFDERLTA